MSKRYVPLETIIGRHTDASKAHTANNNAVLLQSLSPEQIHASCANTMRRIDCLPKLDREIIHQIGSAAYSVGIRIRKAELPPVLRTSRKNKQISALGLRRAKALGLKACAGVDTICKELTLEDLGL